MSEEEKERRIEIETLGQEGAENVSQALPASEDAKLATPLPDPGEEGGGAMPEEPAAPGTSEAFQRADKPQEVVEYYQPGAPREVVETYVQNRPLPQLHREKAAIPFPQKHHHGLGIFLLCLAVIVGLAIAAQFWPRRQSVFLPGDPQEGGATVEIIQGVAIPRYQPEKDVTLRILTEHGNTLSAQEIYQQLNPAVVTVMVQVSDGVSIGTGVIFTTDGYLLTNYHVVSGGKECSITLDSGRTLAAKYVAGDDVNDIAILKAEGADLPAASFGASDDLTVGDKVYAIGNPLGVELRGTLTDGIVSAINRDVTVDGRVMTLIQTNAALNSGNSGGPLINSYGQVVGINTIKMSSTYSTVEGLGFAIPSSSLETLVNDLLTYGEVQPQPRIGISVSQTGTVLPDGTQGIEVLEVAEGLAAAQAGVQVGDIVVLADGDETLTSKDLLRIRRRLHVGDQMTLRVYRSGKYLDFVLTLT